MLHFSPTYVLLLICLMYLYKHWLILFNKSIKSLLLFIEDLCSLNAILVTQSDTTTGPVTSSTTNASSSAMPLPGPDVHAKSVLKLLTFLTVDASSWFWRAEIQFCLGKITNSLMKDDHVLAAISEDLFTQVSAWLNGWGNHISCDDLKVYLLWCFNLSPARRAVRILQLYQQSLRD